ncbi:small ribosomal subunit protein bTHXc-like [Phragmites australis]|uniref:small ribosomal subunit protein bTHXc-like n=1 Tax=Phragmites australis TaxID=29695 RepID=UPI002D79D142|nr:small ribosomal subunit protein bTHXc-like [Phragmites australis]XP_062183607.1 small ribosomal subunit protein bTHXc-like [Phragmites australis]
MALLAVQGMAMSATAFLPFHHHGAVSSSPFSSYALPATAAFSLSRVTLAVTSATFAPVLDVYCGRGDKKTKRGKRFNHSYGNARPHNKKKGTGPPRLYAPPAPPRKDQFDDGEIIPIEIDEDILE